jgi:hypothetical protein
MIREASGGSTFFRIPFGVPNSANLPRPMMVMRTETVVGMGVGIGSVGLGMQGARLEEVPEASEGSRRRDDKSAFVETIEDVRGKFTPLCFSDLCLAGLGNKLILSSLMIPRLPSFTLNIHHNIVIQVHFTRLHLQRLNQSLIQ